MEAIPNSSLVLSSSQHLSPQSHKIRPMFQNKAKWRCSASSDFSYIKKYKPKMLTLIHFIRIGDEQTRTSRVRNLRMAMMSNKRLSCLIFDKHATNQILQLLSSTTHCQKLAFLGENGRCDARGKEDFKSLIRLKRCRDLSDLKMNFAARAKSGKDKCSIIYQAN